MEATASLSSTMASTHFSHSLPLSKISLCITKFPRTCSSSSSSSWTGSTNALSFSSRNSFTEVWRVINSRNVMKQEVAEELQKKIMSAKFDFDDFLEQTRAVAQLGSVTRACWMIPGLGKITAYQIREADKYLIVMESMINVMLPEERKKPELLAESLSRRERVARDSGKTEQQVSQLVAQLFQMRVRMKDFLGVMEGESNPELDNLEEALKAKKEMEDDQQRKAKQENDQMKQEISEELQKKIMSGKFDFNDFLEQTRAVARLAPMPRARWKIPGLGKLTPYHIREVEKDLIVMESMINSMLPEEREKPELLAESVSRRERVARDSEKTEQQVRQLVAQLFDRRVRMKNFLEE